ncbi:hypothetical protein N2603_43215 [Bradyrhizobium huanghuaihaiense]|uniref:hypothetical protein n=1 Tax=Bradyrhizobium huanghuaihaiense TaxID=990078 RepID=UPI0021A99524|nr:hypothetical protein [Bradyrhizobium sp. CB3035]UWU76599.1 hypothetical protein N2603_43215 [Bradyrhizobium sp. CB3035]
MYPLTGLIAPHFIRTGIFAKEDLLDLFDPVIWRQPGTEEAIGLRGPALCAMIVCCGATMAEITRIECSQWLNGHQDEVELSGGHHRAPRTMPVLAIAKVVIERYRKAAKRRAGVDHLFVDRNGNPIIVNGILGQFAWMTKNHGFPCKSLGMALHQAFEGWARSGEDIMARALTGRLQRFWMEPDPPTDLRAKLCFLEETHPVGKFDRGMLKWPGPAARLHADPHFPRLSREARNDLDAALKVPGTSYPLELRQAVQTALSSGKKPKEIAAHYGINTKYIYDVRDGNSSAASTLLTLRTVSVQKILAARMRAAPDSDGGDLQAWMLKEHGVALTRSSIRKFATKEDIKLPTAPRGPNLAKYEPLLREKLSQNPDHDAFALATLLRSEHGVAVSDTAIQKFLRKLDLIKPQQHLLVGHEYALGEFFKVRPAATYKEIVVWLRDERGVLANTDELLRAMKQAGIRRPSFRPRRRKQ